MMKFSVTQWDKNKERLEQDIRNNLEFYNEASYFDLVKKVVEFIFNDEDSDYGNTYDSESITEIDNGDYQGTLLYLIPLNIYQPSENEYLMTYVGYGSCSGCDTLQSIQTWGDIKESDKEQMVQDFMSLCLHIVQNTIKPYNFGWRKDDKFDFVEDKNDDIF
jgi:hypothetical protein